MTVEEAKEWVRQAADTIEFDRCVGAEEIAHLHNERDAIIYLLDTIKEPK